MGVVDSKVSVNDIWNGERYTKFRNMFEGLPAGLPDICLDCPYKVNSNILKRWIDFSVVEPDGQRCKIAC